MCLYQIAPRRSPFLSYPRHIFQKEQTYSLLTDLGATSNKGYRVLPMDMLGCVCSSQPQPSHASSHGTGVAR